MCEAYNKYNKYGSVKGFRMKGILMNIVIIEYFEKKNEKRLD